MYYSRRMIGDKYATVQRIAVDYSLLGLGELYAFEWKWEWLYQLRSLKEVIFIVGYQTASTTDDFSSESTDRQQQARTVFIDVAEQRIVGWHQTRGYAVSGWGLTWEDAAESDQSHLDRHYAKLVRCLESALGMTTTPFLLVVLKYCWHV